MKKISFLILSITIIMISNIAFAFENSTIATDGSNFYAIKDDNSLWAWGENKNGEVGNGTTEACDDPTKIMEDVIYVSPQYAVKSDNTLWTWGKYSDFFSEDNASLVPVKVMDNVKAADVGWSSTLIIKEDNSLWGIGYNNYGQLGQGEILRSSDDLETEYCDPSVYEQPVKIMNNVLDAEAGVNHSIALKTDGSVYTFGAGYYGQLGYGDYLFLSNVPTKVMENVKDIAAGSSSSFALKDDNTYWWCGTLFGEHNDSQELDYYEFEQLDDDIKDISVHYKTSLVLKNDGSLWQYSFTGDGSESVKKKISDNINCISGDDSNGYKTLVLNNDGELFLYDLDGEYTSEKIMDNVKLQEENVSAEQTNFLDIESKSDEAQKAVNALTRAGIIRGVSDTEFAPDAAVTRAEAAALLLRMTAQSDADGNGGFSDVTEDMWYYDTAGASKKYGIISGFEDNTFRGDDRISKVQLISLAARALKNERNVTASETENTYDAPEWAAEEIALALNSGLITENDLSDLNTPISRADAAVILYRLYDRI